MSGKRLLDLAALFNATRSVAQKHLALRARQLDVYNRTSTLAAAVRQQTERVTETAKAASILASRLNESAPAWTKEAEEGKLADHSKNSIPSTKSVQGNDQNINTKDGLMQDHFYERSSSNTATDKLPTSDLNVHQEMAGCYPLPDGTIPPDNYNNETQDADQDNVFPHTSQVEPPKPPLRDIGLQLDSSDQSSIPTPTSKPLSSTDARTKQRRSELQIPSIVADGDAFADPLEEGHDEDVFYRKSSHISPTLSSLPRVKIPKHTSDMQENHTSIEEVNSESFYTAYGTAATHIPAVEAVPEQDQVPAGVNTDIFHSPRVARLVGGRAYGEQEDLKLKAVRDTPTEKTKLADGKDQDTFNVFNSSQTVPRTLEAGQAFTVPHSIPKNANFAQKHIDEAKLAGTLQPVVKENEAVEPEARPYELRESRVPSSRLGRLWNYGGLAAGMLGGAVTESLRRAGGGVGEGSYMLSAGNMDRLVAKLSQMRGAALKLGQMISFQDSKMLPLPIQEILQRVQDRADYMPASQRNKVLIANLGPDWGDLFSSFEEMPLAAASIGQVHRATLKSNGATVAVKIQYPGVADSIDSDLNNLAILLTASRVLPKGLFLDKTIANARTELAWECDYIREAECGRRFSQLLAGEEDTFLVPKIYPEASGKQVLTMEFMNGVGVTRVLTFTQEQKDWIGTQILRLCLREIVEFKYMQTDPNWTNFLYNANTQKLELLDFGASREYPDEFITRYVKLLEAASRSDRDTVRDISIELGYLTGNESKTMLDAHIASVLTLAEPFLESSPEIYDFRDQTITERVKALIPVMIKERLAPPPEETYSLHRKLSGAFLLCARLGSRVRCRELFQNSMVKAGLR
ncbi:kinase-like protein [Bisporella sp. PMI_857]|nr:kinase-like protein [Bisporella sp. PMI_857]